jgi:thiol-disulfide isomerase/thioredoxin
MSVGALLLGLLAACTGQVNAPSTGPVAKVYPAPERKAAPDTTGDLLSGGTYRLSEHRGEVVVINFWASWCAPCRVEAVDLEQVYQSTKADKVTFLGINVQDQRDAAVAFARGRSTYPSVFDPPGRLALAFAVPPNTLPATLIIDRDGRIAVVLRSSVRAEDLKPLVAQIATEAS